MQNLDGEWSRKVADMQDQHNKKQRSINDDWSQKFKNALKENENVINRLSQENIDLQANLDAINQENQLIASVRSNPQFMLEMEKLKAEHIEEMKGITDQLQAQKSKCDSEKAQIREESASKADRYYQDYKEAIQREQILEQMLEEREKESELKLQQKEKEAIELNAQILELKGPNGGN